MLCASVELFRVSEVAEVKPATLSAFDYYKPGNALFFYDSNTLMNKDLILNQLYSFFSILMSTIYC